MKMPLFATSLAMVVAALMSYSSISRADQQDDTCASYGRLARQVWRAKNKGISANRTIQMIHESFPDSSADQMGNHLVRMIYFDMPELSEDGAVRMTLLECNVSFAKRRN